MGFFKRIFLAAHLAWPVGSIAATMPPAGDTGVYGAKRRKRLQNELEVLEWMQFDRGYLSSCFVNNQDVADRPFGDPCILPYDRKISQEDAHRRCDVCGTA